MFSPRDLQLSTLGSCGKLGTEVGRFAHLELELSFPEPSSQGVRELSNGRLLAEDSLEQVLLSLDLASGKADTLGNVGGEPRG